MTKGTLTRERIAELREKFDSFGKFISDGGVMCILEVEDCADLLSLLSSEEARLDAPAPVTEEERKRMDLILEGHEMTAYFPSDRAQYSRIRALIDSAPAAPGKEAEARAEKAEREVDAVRAWWKEAKDRANANFEALEVLGKKCESLKAERDALKAECEKLRVVYWAAAEVLEVADLRGDSDLPHPADDPKMYTARMSDAWDGLRAAIGKEKP